MTWSLPTPKQARVYIVTLRADEPSPLPVLSDEVTTTQPPDVLLPPTPGSQKPTQPLPTPNAARRSRRRLLSRRRRRSEEKTKTERAAAEQKPGTRPPLKNFRIDLEGIQNRIVALPIPPGNLQNLTRRQGSHLLYRVAHPRAFRSVAGRTPGHSRFRLEGAQRPRVAGRRRPVRLVLRRQEASLFRSEVRGEGPSEGEAKAGLICTASSTPRFLQAAARRWRHEVAGEGWRRRPQARRHDAWRSIRPPNGSRSSTKFSARSATISSRLP